MNWAAAGFDIFGLHVLWTDLIGNVCALATVWLAVRRTVWTWPVQLAGSVLLFAASVQAHITGSALKQVLFAVLAVYGWVRWSRSATAEGGLPVRPARDRERALLIGLLAAGTAVVAVVFWQVNTHLFEISWNPLPDAYIFVASAVATYAQARAWIDFWAVWIAVDLVGVPLAVASHLYVSGAVYGIFLILVIIGIRDWRRQYRRNPAMAEAVTA